jgi:hypothetical protein
MLLGVPNQRPTLPLLVTQEDGADTANVVEIDFISYVKSCSVARMKNNIFSSDALWG